MTEILATFLFSDLPVRFLELFSFSPLLSPGAEVTWKKMQQKQLDETNKGSPHSASYPVAPAHTGNAKPRWNNGV